MMMTPGWMGWGGILGMLLWLLLLVLVVVAAIALARALLPSSGEPPRGDQSLETLRERFARGEIDDDEFARRRATLENRRQGVKT